MLIVPKITSFRSSHAAAIPVEGKKEASDGIDFTLQT
jgi:hypothetical protein